MKNFRKMFMHLIYPTIGPVITGGFNNINVRWSTTETGRIEFKTSCHDFIAIHPHLMVKNPNKNNEFLQTHRIVLSLRGKPNKQLKIMLLLISRISRSSTR